LQNILAVGTVPIIDANGRVSTAPICTVRGATA
jgi:hypothetical protein